MVTVRWLLLSVMASFGCGNDIYGPMALYPPELLPSQVELDEQNPSEVRIEIIEKRLRYYNFLGSTATECPRNEYCGGRADVEIHTRPFAGAYIGIGRTAFIEGDPDAGCARWFVKPVLPIDDVEPDRFIFLVPMPETSYQRCIHAIDYDLRAGRPVIDEMRDPR